MTYILSNIRCSRTIPNLVADNDELVFLNMATNWELYRDVPCLKYLYCRSKDHTNEYFTRNEWKGKELQWFNSFKVLEWNGDFDYTEGKRTNNWILGLEVAEGEGQGSCAGELSPQQGLWDDALGRA